MTEKRDASKENRRTALAQLIEIHMQNGMVKTADLAAKTGYSERAIWKAKAELRDSDSECTLNDSSVNHSSDPEPQCRKTLNPSSLNTELQCSPSRAHAPAHKESPSEIVIPSKLVASNAHAGEAEIAGLNGQTPVLAGWLAEWLSPYAPDYQTALEILASNVDLYGPDKVKAGMLELKTQIAGGETPRNLVKAFSGFVKNATAEPGERPPPITKVEAKRAVFMAALDKVGV